MNRPDSDGDIVSKAQNEPPKCSCPIVMHFPDLKHVRAKVGSSYDDSVFLSSAEKPRVA